MSRAKLDDADALDLFSEWQEPVTSRRLIRASVGSLLVHIAVFALLLILPETSPRFNGPLLTADLRKASIPLLAPRVFDLTQREENKGKVTKQLDIRSSLPQSASKARVFVPPAPVGPAAPATALATPPQIQAAVTAPQLTGAVPTLPQPVEKPKIVLENVGPALPPTAPSENPTIKLPSTALDKIASSGRAGGAGGVVISPDEAGEATALRQMQLLSDPLGVDFKPYLLQILARVRKNWLAVVPDSARMGRRGLVLVQFSIDRSGGVPKLVIASPSGIPAFDRAAVAGISASNPFPPLPAAYKGDQIRLQMAFSYNLPPAQP